MSGTPFCHQILSADALTNGSIYTPLSPDFVSFQCFLDAELDNMCLYRCLDTLYN